jgi:hypothetical protein
MDETRFDAWTRRRLGLAAGGLASFALRPETRHAVMAKKKHKHRIRCQKVLAPCDPNDKKRRCCSGLNCDVFDLQVGLRCCLGLRSLCEAGNNQCCGELLCSEVTQLGGTHCCSDGSAPCSEDEDCCFGAPCIQGACAAISDRAVKTNFGSVDPADMLARVRALPISTWNYRSDDPAIRHIGPMAQDFSAAFGVGADDRHISPIDGQGVALAAIQGLSAEVERLREENARLVARVTALEAGQ